MIFSERDADTAVSLIGCLLEHLETAGHSGIPLNKHSDCQPCDDMEAAETFMADINA
jgi:hypothetical protein